MKVNIIYKVLRFFVVNILHPFFRLISVFIPSLRIHFNKTIIELNNLFVRQYKFNKPPNILVLLPHCLQFDDCKYKITKDITNCRSCGKCVIKDFVSLKDTLNIPIKIATGGTLARRYVKETRPDIILACACERDLISGIYDSYPFLVAGILNERPNGPCINTKVNISYIQEFLKNP